MKNPSPQRFMCLAAAVLACSLAGGGAQTLTHRYSFNDTAFSLEYADSVGGESWKGTLMNGAWLDGSQLQLDGNGAFGLMPGSMISGYQQVTIEFWATFAPSNPTWTRTWAFGSQDGTVRATGLDYCHYAGGDWQNLGFVTQTPAADVWANNPGGLNGVTNVHVTAIIDPVNNRMYYYNGSAVRSNPGVNNGSVPPLSGLVDTYALLGKSLFDLDPTLAGSFDEFRVYNGVLTARQVAVNEAAGPNNYVADPGALQAVQLVSPVNPLTVGELSAQKFTGDFANVGGVNLVAYGGAAFESANPAVLTIDSNGVVKAVAPGTTTIVASFESLSKTNSLTVIALPPVLKHRYSFAADVTDSVGGANGTLEGTATVAGGKAVLDGNFGTYVSLPGPTINLTTNKSVTIQAWVDFGDVPSWSRLWNFGHEDGTTEAASELYYAPRVDNGGRHRVSQNINGGRTLVWEGTLSNQTAQITAVIDPPTGTLAIYKNGKLEHAIFNATAPLSLVSNTLAVLGRSLVDADAYMPGAIDEFRIYSGALSAEAVAMTYAKGPNVPDYDPGALQSLKVESATYPSFAGRMPPVITANYANFAGFNLLPNVSAVVDGLTLESSDTNVVLVLANNLIRTFAPGQATLTATYRGKTSSATVTVGNTSRLAHRYSFNGNYNDSISTAHGSPQGEAAVAEGKLVLNGTAGTYLQLPGGLIKDYEAVTVDTWVTFNTGSTWARLWYFGNDRQDEFYVGPVVGDGQRHWFSTGLATVGGGHLEIPGRWADMALHITAVYGNGTMAIYTNGFLERTAVVNGRPEQFGEWYSWIGRSPYPDPYLNCSVDEFRIYNGRLSDAEIQASHLLGPDTLLSTTAPAMKVVASANTVTLGWPAAAAGFIPQASAILTGNSWAPLSNAPALAGNEWQLSLTATNQAQFFRLWR